MVPIEQVPRWYMSCGIGHAVVSVGSHGVYTACGSLWFGAYSELKKRPKRICAKCRAALAKPETSIATTPTRATA